MPYRIKGIATLRYTEEEMTVPRLSYNGEIVEGWVKRPAETWTPAGGDLLWLPPSATKSSDIDRAGSIVEVTEGIDYDWVQAQINKRDRYLDMLRERVRAGALRLTAALAKMLGLNFGDGAELTPLTQFAHQPTMATMKAAEARADYQRLEAAIGRGALPIDPDTRLPVVTGDQRVKTIAAAAASRFAETGDLEATIADIWASVARTRPAP